MIVTALGCFPNHLKVGEVHVDAYPFCRSAFKRPITASSSVSGSCSFSARCSAIDRINSLCRCWKLTVTRERREHV